MAKKKLKLGGGRYGHTFGFEILKGIKLIFALFFLFEFRFSNLISDFPLKLSRLQTVKNKIFQPSSL